MHISAKHRRENELPMVPITLQKHRDLRKGMSVFQHINPNSAREVQSSFSENEIIQIKEVLNYHTKSEKRILVRIHITVTSHLSACSFTSKYTAVGGARKF
jgi:hypothetical protein